MEVSAAGEGKLNRSLGQRSGSQKIKFSRFNRVPGQTPLFKRPGCLEGENYRTFVVMSCTTNLTHHCLLSAVNSDGAVFREKIISVKQDAINFFIRQLVNWLQLVEIRNLSSNDKGIRDPVLRVRESGIRCVASRIYTVLPSSLFTFSHPRRFQVQKVYFIFKRKFL